jgi:hypothetical protein
MPGPVISGSDSIRDYGNVMVFIDQLIESFKCGAIVIDPDIVRKVVQEFAADFPHKPGIAEASAFKVVANFVCYFIAERPIKSSFPEAIFGQLAAYDNHQNAIVAFSIARAALHNSVIHRPEGNVVVENQIEISPHSYCDIIDALTDATPLTHFKMVAVLLEQLVYKTNRHCQYEIASLKT